MDNTKRETFRRLLDSRLPKTLKSIKLLGNLSRKGQYRVHTPRGPRVNQRAKE